MAALCYEGHHDLFYVFTGLRTSLPCGIVEIDPMDICPSCMVGIQGDLESRLFWRSTPSLQRDQFDFHGAEYVFVGVDNVSGSLILDANSAFFAVICDGDSECTNATSMVRNWTLPCTSLECGSSLSHLKVGSVI